MLAEDVIKIIESKYERDAALSFDNVGLQIGREDKKVAKIFLALDATDEVIEHAAVWQADMLITHHPMIFGPLKSVRQSDYIGRRIIRLIQEDIPYYAMHTNYDVLGMAQLAGDILELDHQEVLEESYFAGEFTEGIGRVGTLPKAMNLQECCDFVKDRLKLSQVKVFADFEDKEKRYRRMAVSPGSGKSMLVASLEKKAEILVTGDIDHHAGLDAVAQGLTIIDAGHYGTEYIFMDDIKKFLEEHTQGIEIKTEMIAPPFHII
ncbi:MAG: Nif3-like dinuclear metal center hexameric protein [Hespellia sp.]|nr:Nif3-like dinuclear metal center hexameric protein [Hespellia sp.]